MTNKKPLSTRPYLLRAFYDWIVDSGMTPNILVDTLSSDVRVPEQHIENGTIILNISPNATHGLAMGNEWIEFSASFSDVLERISFPVKAVLGIYAEENNQGLFFSNDDEEYEEDDDDGGGDGPQSPQPGGAASDKSPSGRPKLRIVK